MDQLISEQQALQINSLAFLFFAIIAIAAYRMAIFAERKLNLGHVWQVDLRSVVLCIANLYFLQFFIFGAGSILILCGLLASTYALGWLNTKADREGWELSPLFGFSVVVFWALLFLAKDPELVSILNPFHYYPLKLIGLSFLFFRCINYIEDAPILPNHSPVDFVNFMVFFPTLISGPLARCDNFIEDKLDSSPIDFETALSACQRIATGFIKKFVIADALYPLTALGGADTSSMPVTVLWCMFVLQLFVFYLDFAGYTDIVLGIGRLMGFKLPENFNKPFTATNVQEFWDRWHMSLTSFITDYFFTPLAGMNFRHVAKQYQFAVLVVIYFFTMMVIALWHDTSWGFVVFGIMHGLALVYLQVKNRYADSFIGPFRILAWRMPRLAAQITTYLFNCLAMLIWVMGPIAAGGVLVRMFGLQF